MGNVQSLNGYGGLCFSIAKMHMLLFGIMERAGMTPDQRKNHMKALVMKLTKHEPQINDLCLLFLNHANKCLQRSDPMASTYRNNAAESPKSNNILL
jgi:hypothetical protein